MGEQHPPGPPAPFLQLGGVVLGEDSIDELLERVVQLAAATVPTAHSVSVTVSHDGDVYTSNSSGPDAVALDQAQYEQGDGPCLQALEGQQIEGDLDGAARWPKLSTVAADLGVRRALSTPLTVRDRTLGALNIYSQAERGFSDTEKQTAHLFAGQAAVLLANAFALMSSVATNEQLREALASREIIGEAKGILMQQQGCTRDQAFDLLRRASQRENRKLRDLAEALVLAVESRGRE